MALTTLVNETMAVSPTTGSAIGSTGIWNAGGWYVFTDGGTFEFSDYEYTGLLPSMFVASMDMKMSTTSGGDSSWFYYGWGASPQNEGDSTNAGYLIERNIFGNTIAIRYAGVSLANTTYTKDTNFDTVKIVVEGQHFTIYYNGTQVLDFTDSTTRNLPGRKYGWGARSGGTGATQQVRNLSLQGMVSETAVAPKTYVYHSYKNGAFQGVLTNVISDFAYQQEINSAGSAITIVLGAAADSYGEGSLIDFNNEIDVYVIDNQVPNGLLIFKGYIVNYKPVFSEDNQERVELTVMGYGATLNDYVLESSESTDVNQSSQTGNSVALLGPDAKFGGYTDVIESFTVGGGVTKLSAVEWWLAAQTAGDLGSVVLCQVFSAQADAESGGLTSLVASASLPLSSLTGQAYKFTFASAITVTSGNVYWARLSISSVATRGNAFVYYDNTSPYPGGIMETLVYDGSALTFTTSGVSGDAYIKTYQSAGNTQFSYNSQDPSAILKSIMDNFAAQGGKITYTSASVDLTNTTVTYTFNASTIFDALNKVLTIAPVGWYWYIDQANNVIHFHKVASTATHSLGIGKNIKNLAVEKRTQELVNVVYFVGGPIAGTNLYNKYVQQTSIDLYGRHALVYQDNNVTLSATAQIIANNILSSRGQVELRIDLDILDNGGSASSILGFNIESITLGESISFRSFGPGSGGTKWDVAKWDQAKWDFDITDLSSVIVQVTKMDYQPDVLRLSMSTVPPDITKRVQDIYRNLQQANVLNNPATPS